MLPKKLDERFKKLPESSTRASTCSQKARRTLRTTALHPRKSHEKLAEHSCSSFCGFSRQRKVLPPARPSASPPCHSSPHRRTSTPAPSATRRGHSIPAHVNPKRQHRTALPGQPSLHLCPPHQHRYPYVRCLQRSRTRLTHAGSSRAHPCGDGKGRWL